MYIVPKIKKETSNFREGFDTRSRGKVLGNSEIGSPESLLTKKQLWGAFIFGVGLNGNKNLN